MCDTKGNDFLQSYLNETGIDGKSLYFTKVNLRDVFGVIESVDYIDAFQLVFGLCVTILAVFGNILNIIVLWEVSFTHPAQTLRLSLAVTDFFTGISHCFLAICDHFYFLWCARDPANCEHEVDIVLFSNRLEIIRRGYPMLSAIVFMIMFTSSFAYLVISAVDRFIAIYRPLGYPSIVTMKLVRTQIVFWLCLSIAYTFGMITRGDYTSWKSAYRPDDKTSILFMDPYHYFINGIVHKCYFLLVIVIFLGLILSTLWYLKKAGRARRALTSQDMKDETEIEVTKTLLFVIFAFLFSVVPSYTRHFFGREVLCNYVNFFVTWLFLSSSTMNFLIYNVRNPAFRRKTRQILQKGISTVTGKLHTCRLIRDEVGKDQHKNKSGNNRSVGTKYQQNPRLKLTVGKKLSHNDSMSNVGNRINTIDITSGINTIIDNTSCIRVREGHNSKEFHNIKNNISNTSSKKYHCSEQYNVHNNQIKTCDIYNKDKIVLYHTSPVVSTDRMNEKVNIPTLNMPINEDINSGITIDVKYPLKDAKIEFTLHM